MADNQFPFVPLSIPDTGQHLRLVSTSLNNTINGKLNSTGTITLRASQTTTTLTDARISGNLFTDGFSELDDMDEWVASDYCVNNVGINFSNDAVKADDITNIPQIDIEI